MFFLCVHKSSNKCDHRSISRTVENDLSRFIGDTPVGVQRMKEPKNNIQTGKVINYHSYCLPEMTVTWLFLRHRINLCTFIVQ